MTPELFWIPGPWRGKLAISARPRGGDWLEDELNGWRLAGVDVIVSLLEKEEAAELGLDSEADIAESRGIQFTSFPIPDRGIPASMPSTLSLMRRTVEALQEGKNVAIHCRQGIGRSGLIASGVLVMSGLGAEKALQAVSAARRQTVPETAEQRRWIQHLPIALVVVTS